MASFPQTEIFLNTFFTKYSTNSRVNPSLPCELTKQDKSSRDIPRDNNIKTIKKKLDINKVVNIIGIGGCGKSTVTRLFIVGNNYQDDEKEFNEEKNKYKDGFKTAFSNITDIIINTNDVYKEFCDRFVKETKICNYSYENQQPNYKATFKSFLSRLNDYSTSGGKKNLFIMDVNETANYKEMKNVIECFRKTCSSDWKLLVVSREALCDKEEDFVDVSRVDQIDSDFINRLFFNRLSDNREPYYRNNVKQDELEKVFTKLGNLPILIRALAEYLNNVSVKSVSEILDTLGEGNLTDLFRCRSLNKEEMYESIGNFLGKLSIFKNLDNDIQKRIVSTMMLWPAEYYSQSFISQIVFNNKKVGGFVYALSDLCDKCWLDHRDDNGNLTYKMHGLIAENSRRQVFDDDDNIKYRDFSTYIKNIERITKLEDNERTALCQSLINYDLTANADFLLRQAHDFGNANLYEKALKIKFLKIKNSAVTDQEIYHMLHNDGYISKSPVDVLYYSWLKDAPGYQNKPKAQFTVEGKAYKMIKVHNGGFFMGAQTEYTHKANYDEDASGGEFPVHKVTLDSFFVSETPVTQVLWNDVMQDKMPNPSAFKYPNRPVDNVSWFDCLAFIMELNRQTKLKFRLPTEAEWEFAARGGKSGGTKYSGSDNIDEVAVHYNNSDDLGRIILAYGTHPVKSKKSNSLGIYDMSGNVWEWCQDWYGDYPSGSVINPTGPVSGSNRVLRGGSWNNFARFCRVSDRYRNFPYLRYNAYGFRLSLSSQQKKEKNAV